MKYYTWVWDHKGDRLCRVYGKRSGNLLFCGQFLPTSRAAELLDADLVTMVDCLRKRFGL